MERPRLLAEAGAAERWGWVIGGAAGMGLMLVTRNFVLPEEALPLLIVGGLAALMVVGGWMQQGVRTR